MATPSQKRHCKWSGLERLYQPDAQARKGVFLACASGWCGSNRPANRICCLITLLLAASLVRADERKTTVGMTGRIDQLVLPGSELEVRPLDRQAPVVVRIVEVYPHGTAFRYDLVYYGLEPGEFDLKPYFRRKDATATIDLPSIRVTVDPTLPPGQIQPHKLEPKGSPFLGGYFWIMSGLVVVWMLGLAALVLAGRHKRTIAAHEEKPLTLADQLRPLVEQAMAGTLTTVQRADLERMLLAYWKKRLDLSNVKPNEAFATLRKHAEAGPLLEQLEIWLHRPGPAAAVDLTALLRPYRDVVEFQS